MLKGGLSRTMFSMQHLLQWSERCEVMKECSCKYGDKRGSPFIELFQLEKPSKIIESSP